MKNEGIFLKYIDIPFSYSFFIIILVRIVGMESEALPYVTFIAGLFASTLELIDISGKILRRYSKKRWKNAYLVTKDGHYLSISKRIHDSFKNTNLQRPKDRITGIVYLIILLFTSMVSLSFSKEEFIIKYHFYLMLVFLICIGLISVLLMSEGFHFPNTTYFVAIHSSYVLDYIDGGNWVDPLSKAIEDGNWVLANHWAARGKLDRFINIIDEKEIPIEGIRIELG